MNKFRPAIHSHTSNPTDVLFSEEGTYNFDKDITSNIVVVGKNIILNLNGFTFKTIYILVSDNISIRNGIINLEGVSSNYGIYCMGSKDIEIKNITVKNLTCSNITNYTVPVGILFTGSDHIVCTNCTVENLNVNTGSVSGIQITDCKCVSTVNCVVKNLINNDGSCVGIGCLNSTDVTFINCRVNNLKLFYNGNVNTANHTCVGIILNLTSEASISDCIVENLIGAKDDTHGISIFFCKNSINIRNCRVLNIQTSSESYNLFGSKATGIEIYTDNVIVNNCWVKNIEGVNPQYGQVAGFTCGSCSGVKFINCVAENIKVLSLSDKNIGIGFGYAVDHRPGFKHPAVNSVYAGCEAINCQVGFDLWFQQNSIWINSVITQCKIGKLILDTQRILFHGSNESTTIINIESNNHFISL